MKIEFLLVKDIGERCTQMTAFNVPTHMKKNLKNRGFFQGICIIDTVPVKWAFSGLSHDGDIFTTNEMHRSIIHAMLPIFIFNEDMEHEQYEEEEMQRLELGWDLSDAELKEEQDESDKLMMEREYDEEQYNLQRWEDAKEYDENPPEDRDYPDEQTGE